METFSNGEHTIYFGDAINGLAAVADASVDLVFCDPPYNIGKTFGSRKERWSSDDDYIEWCHNWLELCVAKLKPTGSLYLMAATQSMPFLDIFLRKRMSILSRIVWNYDSSGVQAKKYFGSLYEPILHCVIDASNYTFNADAILVAARTGAERKLIDYRKAVPQPYNNEKVPGNVWNFPRVRYRMPEYEEHPSQKPIALLERIILASSNAGDIVLDPFSGTFTTSAVAASLGRRSIGIELEETYVKVGLRRVGIATEYKGERLSRPLKSYEESVPTEETLMLLETPQ
jgi:site-specific DNA-methyltransferase (adenine-specific)